MTKPLDNIIKGLIIALFIFFGYQSTEKKPEKPVDQTSGIPDPPDNDYTKVKSFDYQNNTWNTYEPFIPVQRSKNYSDEEIRIIREKHSFNNDGSYIYTPGRHVPTQKELTEQAIEDYIDEHGEELYEQLEDRYGD